MDKEDTFGVISGNEYEGGEGDGGLGGPRRDTPGCTVGHGGRRCLDTHIFDKSTVSKGADTEWCGSILFRIHGNLVTGTRCL